jgi:hypothetical protein
MPNHVRNVVKFEQLDEGKTVSELLQEIHGEEENQYISFNKIIPMAEELDINSGSKMYISRDIYRWKNGETLEEDELRHMHICADDKDNTLTDEEAAEKCISSGIADMKLAEQTFENEKKYGYPDWYNWRIANWGTKWDAYDQYQVDENTIAFNTAWSDPTPIVRKLAKDNTNMRIDHKFADEMPNFVGHTVYERGEKVYDQIYYEEKDQDKVDELYGYCWSDNVMPD